MGLGRLQQQLLLRMTKTKPSIQSTQMIFQSIITGEYLDTEKISALIS